MENSLKVINACSRIIITALSVSDFILQEAREILPPRELGRSISCSAEFTDASKTMYDGTGSVRSEVLNVIRKFSDETMGICTDE